MEPRAADVEEARLDPDAIGFVDALVIGLDSTSPAYSLAAVLGPIVALVGVYAPGVLLASFVPMLFVASAFFYLNSVDQDCGTTFSWVTRAIGPWFGWIGGWAITMTGVLVIGSLADVGVRFSLLDAGARRPGREQGRGDRRAVALILVMTALCVLGTELSARVQNVLIIAQVLALLAFAAVALVRAAAATAARTPSTPAIGWLNPFGAGGAALTGGLLLGVFAYWGWESAVNLSEETRTPPRRRAGRRCCRRSSCWSRTSASRSRSSRFAGPGVPRRERRGGGVHLRPARHRGHGRLGLGRAARGRDVRARLHADDDHPRVADRAVHGPPPRAAAHLRPHPPALPHARRLHLVGRRHRDRLVPRRQPDQRERALRLAHRAVAADRVLLRAHRARLRHLLPPPPAARAGTTSLLIGVGPVVGAVLLLWLLVESVIDMSDPENSYSGSLWFGLGPPLVIGIAIVLVGVLLMVLVALPRRQVLAGAPRRRGGGRADPRATAARGSGPGTALAVLGHHVVDSGTRLIGGWPSRAV